MRTRWWTQLIIWQCPPPCVIQAGRWNGWQKCMNLRVHLESRLGSVWVWHGWGTKATPSKCMLRSASLRWRRRCHVRWPRPLRRYRLIPRWYNLLARRICIGRHFIWRLKMQGLEWLGIWLWDWLKLEASLILTLKCLRHRNRGPTSVTC